MKKITIFFAVLILLLSLVFVANIMIKKKFFAQQESIKRDTIFKSDPIKEKCDTTYAFQNGVARIRLKGKYGLINKAGKQITTIKYDNISRFDHGVACVRINGKWGIINNKGKELTPLKYDFMQETNNLRVLCLYVKDKMMLLDEDYNPIEYNPSGYFSDLNSYFDESGITKVCLNGKWGFIDKTGREITKIKYDYVFFFSEGMARVLLNGKWGFINESGEEVIPVIYLDYGELKGICEIGEEIENNRTVYLDKEGKAIDYSIAEYYNEYPKFNQGLVRVRYESIYGFSSAEPPAYIFLDKKGKVVNEIKSKDHERYEEFFYYHGKTKEELSLNE